MSATVSRTRVAISGLGLMGFVFAGLVMTVAAIGISDGNPAIALAPPLLLALAWGAWKLPLRSTVLTLIFLMLIADYLSDMPYSNHWQSPFHKLGELLFLNLSSVTGVSVLRMPALDLATVGLWLIAIVKRSNARQVSQTASVRPLNAVLLLELGTVLALYAWGASQGGNANEALWQIRQLVMFPIRAVLLLRTLDGSRAEMALVARVVIAAACIKSLCGLYFLYTIVKPWGLVVEFTTSHTDTLMFVPLLSMAFALFLEQPTKKRLGQGLLWAPLVFWGLVANDRRIAWVSLGACLFTVVAMNPWTPIKRFITRIAILMIPVAVLYVAAGWNSNNPVFAGSQLIKSLVKGDQAQQGADYRDMENFNVLYTWSESPFLPKGFGWQFELPVVMPDISKGMPMYRYHPHNQILWMWTIGGPIGFTFLFLPMAFTVLLAARSYRRARHPIDRTCALTAICMVITHLNQCFGDMGTINYFGSWGCALMLALASKQAIRLGAWPEGVTATPLEIPEARAQ